NAAQYDELFAASGLLADTAGSQAIVTPLTVTNRHIFNQYVVRVPQRDELKAALQAKGIGTEVYYPVPMHVQDCFAYLGHKPGASIESERAAKSTLALPVYPEVSKAQIEYVVSCVAEFYAGRRAEASIGAGAAAAI